MHKPNQQQHQKPKAPGGGANSGVRGEKMTRAPAAVAIETATKFSPVVASKRFKDGVVVEGSDHLEYVVVPNTNNVGDVLNEVYINPSELGGTRLEKFSALYEKFLFEKLEFEYLPAVGSDKRGAIVLAYDRDISDPTPPPSEQGVRDFTSFEDAKDGNIWTPHRIRCPLLAPDAGYYTNPVAGGDDRLAYQGQVYVATTVPIEQGTIGRLRVHYKCHFFVPQLANANLVAAGSSAYGGPYPVQAAGTDFIKQVKTLSAPVWNGVQQWLPKLDSNGKYYIDLASGLYKMYSQIMETTSPGSTATNTGINSLDPPTLVPNEPMPATAPQPFVELSSETLEYSVATDQLNGFDTNYYLGVPRGGAKLYQTFQYETGQTGGSGNTLFDIELQRLGGYVPTTASLFLARWQGREECVDPRNHWVAAAGRGKRPLSEKRLVATSSRAPSQSRTALPARPSRTT